MDNSLSHFIEVVITMLITSLLLVLFTVFIGNLGQRVKSKPKPKKKESTKPTKSTKSTSSRPSTSSTSTRSSKKKRKTQETIHVSTRASSYDGTVFQGDPPNIAPRPHRKGAAKRHPREMGVYVNSSLIGHFVKDGNKRDPQFDFVPHKEYGKSKLQGISQTEANYIADAMEAINHGHKHKSDPSVSITNRRYPSRREIKENEGRVINSWKKK